MKRLLLLPLIVVVLALLPTGAYAQDTASAPTGFLLGYLVVLLSLPLYLAGTTLVEIVRQRLHWQKH